MRFQALCGQYSVSWGMKLAHWSTRLGGLGCYIQTRNTRHQPVIQMRPYPAEHRLPFCGIPDGGDHFRTLLPLGNPLRDQFRGVLQIGIHGNHRIGARSLNSSGQCYHFAEVAREVNDLDPFILLCQTTQHLQGVIRAVIIDKDVLPIVAGGRRATTPSRS